MKSINGLLYRWMLAKSDLFCDDGFILVQIKALCWLGGGVGGELSY